MLYNKIKEVCKREGVSVSYVEKQAGLSNGVISKWNEVRPIVDNLAAVAKILGCTMDELMAEPDKDPKT